MSEWVFVKPKKRKQTPARVSRVKSHTRQSGGVSQAKIDRAVYLSAIEKDEHTDEVALATLLEQVATARMAIRTTPFYAACVAALQLSLAAKGGLPFSSAVLLGLGQFSRGRCMPSLLQLALVLELLAEQCLFGGAELPPATASIFDPVMTRRDAELCAELGLVVTSQEQQQAGGILHLQPVRAGVRTLFYMPHCPYLLYNHIIWTNWHAPQLTSLVILGNSFESYNTRHLEHRAAATWDCVRRLSEILDEQGVWQQSCSRQNRPRQQGAPSASTHPCLSSLEHAFNDMSVLCYLEAAVCSAAGRRLLAPGNRASAQEVAAAVRADLEMIDSSSNAAGGGDHRNHEDTHIKCCDHDDNVGRNDDDSKVIGAT